MPDPAGPWGAGDRFPPTRRSVVLDHRARRLGRRHRAAILLVLAYVLMRVLLILILGR